ncbi:hypothetical protein FWH58_01330 [Candidatus Saccharibacteria bacterium]|nr:hypothetical protein [Candidatus Saccharibacteria bacterium]
MSEHEDVTEEYKKIERVRFLKKLGKIALTGLTSGAVLSFVAELAGTEPFPLPAIICASALAMGVMALNLFVQKSADP